MTTLLEQSLEQVMKERGSVKRYDKEKTIPEATLNEIIRLAGTAPSAWNLQHWKFIVIRDQALKDKVTPIANHQLQVAECSALVVVLADLEANRNAEEVYAEAVRAGQMTEDVKKTLIAQIDSTYASIPNIGLTEGYKNSSFAAMQLMLAAKAFGIDSCPMGGFNPSALKELLNIPGRYAPSILISLGYGTKPARPSSRFALDKIVVQESF